MTQAPLKPCRRPACPGLTRDRDGYCNQHKDYGQARLEQQKARRNRNKKRVPFYGSVRWQRFRNWYKQSHPLCEHCKAEGKTVPMYCVDHIVEIRDGGELLSEDNAQSLCRKCHGAKTMKARRERRLRG